MIIYPSDPIVRQNIGRRVSTPGALLALLSCLVAFSHIGDAYAQRSRRARVAGRAPARRAPVAPAEIPEATLLAIIRAEDERRWDVAIAPLLFDRNTRLRLRVALAAGRIGDQAAVPSLITLLQADKQSSVRARAAFALGLIASPSSAGPLMNVLQDVNAPQEARARSIEALGRIAASQPKPPQDLVSSIGESIVQALTYEARSTTGQPSVPLILLGLTSVLRARPPNCGPVIALFLSSQAARVRADAANVLARMSLKDGVERMRILAASDKDAIVRANSARALGAAQDKDSADALVSLALSDPDARVRVSAIRALGSIKEPKTAAPLLNRGTTLFASYRSAKGAGAAHPEEASELLEIASSLGRILANTGDARALAWLREFREEEHFTAPEVEIAFARMAPSNYLREKPFNNLSNPSQRTEMSKNWREPSSIAQALGEFAGMTSAAAGNGAALLQADAQIILRGLLEDSETPPLAVPEVLRALAAFKSKDMGELLRAQLRKSDVIIRATAAELIGKLEPDAANQKPLSDALVQAMRADEMNDAALAILDALATQKSAAAHTAIQQALDSPDHLVRRRAVALLKENKVGDFSSKIGFTLTRNQLADYNRALSRRNASVRATVTTEKGSFIIELLSSDAPLNVDNFIQLAKKGFFNGIEFHRVVPNFVIQGGDPRGDGNGGPGYQIRCEINEIPYERGAVGMALSGKDTGGSQWFVTHSPQPHLDGGYTVFGRVVEGTDVIDRIARGDKILGVSVSERPVVPGRRR